MKWVKYSKFTGEDFGIDAQDLLQALADFFLESGFNTQYSQFSEWDSQNLEDLKRAIQDALESGQLFSDDQMQQMMERLSSLSPEQMDQLLDKLVQKLADEGHISVDKDPETAPGASGGRGREAQVRFEVTDKSLDFLG